MGDALEVVLPTDVGVAAVIADRHQTLSEVLAEAGIDTSDLVGHRLHDVIPEIERRLAAAGFPEPESLRGHLLSEVVGRIRAWHRSR